MLDEGGVSAKNADKLIALEHEHSPSAKVEWLGRELHLEHGAVQRCRGCSVLYHRRPELAAAMQRTSGASYRPESIAFARVAPLGRRT